MLILLTLIAFAWIMALNLYILLYQQYNVALMAHLRNSDPELYQRSKTWLSFSLLFNTQQIRQRLSAATPNIPLNDALVEGILNDLAGMRKRGIRTMAIMTALLLVVGVWVISNL